MGWLTVEREKGISNEAFFRRDLGLDIVACGTKDSVFYAAVRVKVLKNKVAGFIAQIAWAPTAIDNFSYKAMDETMGPDQARCPESVLRALSPLEELYAPGSPAFNAASEWRNRCWEHIFMRRRRPTVRRGDTIRFAEKIQFRNDDILDTFVFLKGSLFERGGLKYRIPNWRNIEYEVVKRKAQAS